MTLARSVADVLADHVSFEVESIDRMYLNVWVPRLAYGGGVWGFFVGHRGHQYASTALRDPMTRAFVADIHGFVAARGLELVHFAKGQRKDDLTQQFLATFTEDEGVLFVGRAQEKAGVWRTQRRHNPASGGSYAWLVRSSAFITFFYFYCVWGSRSRLVPLTWVLGALGRQGMIAGRVVAAAVPDLSQASESAVVAWSLVGV